MADRPIIFSAPMIRALLDGRKTQTRRVLNPQPYAFNHPDNGRRIWNASGCVGGRICICDRDLLDLHRKPFPGDRLYVREAFVTGFNTDETGQPVGGRKVWYRATDAGLTWYDFDSESTLDNPSWKPSIHMPRWASRLTLTVTDVRVQRLQDISEADAVAEGCLMDPEPNDDGSHFPAEIAHERGGDVGWDCARDWFADLWDSLHGPDAWDANPWVVALTFDLHRGNIDQIGRVK